MHIWVVENNSVSKDAVQKLKQQHLSVPVEEN